MVGSRQTRIASANNDNIGRVAAAQRRVDLLILEIDSFEPIIVDKILVEIRGSEILATVLRTRKIFQLLLSFNRQQNV